MTVSRKTKSLKKKDQIFQQQQRKGLIKCIQRLREQTRADKGPKSRQGLINYARFDEFSTPVQIPKSRNFSFIQGRVDVLSG